MPMVEDGPPSPWSALLKDNLSADEVAGFLSNAIARKEATLLSGAGMPPSADSPRQRPVTYVPSSRRPLAAPFSAERVRDRRPSLAPSASAVGAEESLESSRPGACQPFNLTRCERASLVTIAPALVQVDPVVAQHRLHLVDSGDTLS